MTPADIAALRTLLGRAKAAGWVFWQEDSGWSGEHTLTRRDLDSAEYVALINGVLSVHIEGRKSWGGVPAESVAQVTTVLELAGALPAAEVDAEVKQLQQLAGMVLRAQESAESSKLDLLGVQQELEAARAKIIEVLGWTPPRLATPTDICNCAAGRHGFKHVSWCNSVLNAQPMPAHLDGAGER